MKTADIGLATATGCNTGRPAVAADISTQGHEPTGKLARRVSTINASIAQWETARNGTYNWTLSWWRPVQPMGPECSNDGAVASSSVVRILDVVAVIAAV